MKAKAQSFAFACGLAIFVFSWGAGSAHAQASFGFTNSGVPTSTGTGGFAPLAGFFRNYGYQPPSPPSAFSNPPLVTVPKVLTSYVPSYEGLHPFYGPRFAGGGVPPDGLLLSAPDTGTQGMPPSRRRP